MVGCLLLLLCHSAYLPLTACACHRFAKPAGLLLSALVVVVYTVALRFEGPFTANIYAQAAREKSRTKTIDDLRSVDGPARGTRSSAANSPAPATRRTRSSKKAD